MIIELNPLEVLPVGVPAGEAVAKAVPSRATFKTTRGFCAPFGPSVRANGINFALFSRHATRVDLVLFEAGREEPIAEIPLDPTTNKTGDVWHILVHGLSPKIEYGYRVHGPHAPQVGHRFSAKTLLLDPYAPALSGGFPWGERGSHVSATTMARRGRLIFDDFDWGDDCPLSTPMAQTVLYEMHVRGFTRHPSSGVKHPGTFLGMIEKIPYLKTLGVTAVQLMPILEFDEHDQVHRNPVTGETLKNYWGYAQISFFAPKAGYAAHMGQQLNEFKQMVKAYHAAGLEVILDVVYNHTCEGNEQGPTLGFRGLDNLIYYMLDRQGQYYNFSGCGNTLNCNHPVVRTLIIDSLTYLANELHIDGFRFDLASILGRGNHGKVLDEPPLLHQIAEDPRLAGCKLIAEAWDAAGLSQLGKFPTWGRWAELNGQFRDDVRRFVRSEPNAAANLAKRICGSLDIYGDNSRHPYHSINFVTCHDGFTLNDLVSYNHKHNWENGEANRDGWDDNLSYNCGHEGPTGDGHINHIRQKQMRNFMSILFLSQGVPLLTMGDELARTQKGNNNAYCQDNEVNWVDWNLTHKHAGLLRFTRMMIALRKRHFAVGREEFVRRVSWHGTKVSLPDWTGQSRTLAFLMYGGHGKRHFYVMFNTHWEGQRFHLPAVDGHMRWQRLVDTNLASPEDIVEENAAVWLNPADHYFLAPRSMVILISG